MKPALIVQLARFGDLIQTKRLVLGLAAAGRPVHMLVDSGLGRLAELVYPEATVRRIGVHAPPDPAGLAGVLEELAATGFHRVYTLNFAGVSLAVSALFDPASVRGHRLERGQPGRDPWAAMAMRWTKNRRQAAVNLADFWAGYALPMFPSAEVNPVPTPRGGGLGVALAGRHARRSPPPDVLANLAQALLPRTSGKRIALLGTAAERAAARQFQDLLPPRLAGLCQDLTGRTDWDTLVETVSGLDRLLTPDTGLMHLAAHLGVPVTATFLSSAWCHETGPYGAGHEVWQSVAPCCPCLESAPCPHALECLEPLRTREFLRLASGRAGEPPEGLTLFRTDLDELGVFCQPVAGRDDGGPARARLRAFVARGLGLDCGQLAPPAPDLAERLVEEPDFMLDKLQALHEGL